MLRIQFRLSMPSIEGVAQVGEMFIGTDDLIVALNTANEKKPGLVTALRAAMPMLGKVKASDIEIGVFAYEPQLLLFDVPAKKHNEVLEEEAAFELFVHDSDPTLST